MNLYKSIFLNAKKHCSLIFTSKTFINTQIIKQYQKQLEKTQRHKMHYPKTFQEKMILVNDPKTVQLLEIVEYGVKYKQGRIWWPLLLIGAALFGYIIQKILPIRVNNRYFTISPESSDYFFSYIFSGFNFQRPFYIYLPAMFGVYQLSRFININHVWSMIAINFLVGNLVSQLIVNQRISKYQMWENYSICFGEGNLLSFLFSFWSYIGFNEAFTHLKSKLFLKAVRGKGIVRKGIPFGYMCLIYGGLQSIFYIKGAKNSEVLLVQILTGILMGLILRRVKPIIK